MTEPKATKNKLIRIGAAGLTCIFLAVVGGLLGAYLGGNLFENVRLFGVRGYEALGLAGVCLGGAGGLFLARKLLT